MGNSMNPSSDSEMALCAVNSIALPVVVMDEAMCVLAINPAAERLMNLEAEKARGRPFPLAGAANASVESRRSIEVENGSWTADLRVEKVLHGERVFHVATLTDTADRRRLQEALRATMLMDELTGLLNRRGFLTLTQQQLKSAKRSQKGLFVVLVVIRNLADLGKWQGARVSDAAALDMARIVRGAFRDSDIVGRIASDELAVTAIEAGYESRGLLLQRLNQSVMLRNADAPDGQGVAISVGAARYDPFTPCSIEELLGRARASLETADASFDTVPLGVDLS
jgi:diguanylate cyclase (GGDEF)-like protein